jgi:hypothetical protein
MKGIESVSESVSADGKTSDFDIVISGAPDKIKGEILKFIIKNKWGLLAMETRQNDLEKIFINLVNQHERSKR